MATKKNAQPTIESVILNLAEAEAESKNINAEASVVRAKKSGAAVEVIRTAFDVNSDEKPLRSSLLSAGVAKGTASKIITVLRAVREGKITHIALAEANSLSGLYALATATETTEPVATAPAGPAVVEVIVEKQVEYATVEDMAEALIARFILSAEDPFTASGKVLMMLTNKIDAAVAPFAHTED